MMAPSKNVCGQKCKTKTKQGKDNDQLHQQSNSISSTNGIDKCVICDDAFDDEFYILKCDNCGKSMHVICWDPDMPDEACKYMHKSQSSGSSSLHIYCAACIKFVDKLREFDSRLRTLEGKISVQNDANFQGEPLVVNLPPLAATYAAAVTNCKSTPPMQGPATANIQHEITEAMEQEKRKIISLCST